MVIVLAPVSRLWSIIEEVRNISGKENNERMKECVTLFEQSVLLIGQVFNTLAYQRRRNALSTLIENNVRIKQIFKEPSLNMDDVDNNYLFGKKLRKSWVKIRMLNRSRSRFLQFCKIKTHHLDHHLTVSSSFDKAVSPRISAWQGIGCGFQFERAFRHGKNSVLKSIYSTGRGNSEPRGIFIYTFNNKKVDLYGETQKCSNMRTTCIVHGELVENNKQPSEFRLFERE